MFLLARLVIARNRQDAIGRCGKTLVALGAMIVSVAASAQGSVSGATITSLGFNNEIPNAVFISINIGKTNNPACSTNTAWSFILPLTTTFENQMLAGLLAARATGTPVTLNGTGACSTYSNLETLFNVTY